MATEQEEEDSLVTSAEIRRRFKVSKFTIDKWRHEGKLHPIYPFGRPPDPEARGNYPVRYKKSEVDYLFEHLQDHNGV